MDETSERVAEVDDRNAGWRGIQEWMPELLLELMCGLRCSECESVREFFVLKDKAQRPGPGFRFSFHEDDHDHLRDKIDRLVGLGCIAPVASEGPPLYRMTDEFAGYLLGGWPGRRWPEWLN